ncbi:hypothetical protein CLV92_10674 [Kineococcus xinjiangensis]|uniref:DUF6504 domain-containing protein n=1 Tax=Kineococcus xinjiangensis TaxID=512762 RepID=A0A2S6ILY8_9ACTN|nr:DUF6504 family protein [Kineococcus xinjiangensis]PPK95253.1 hypothetical protein CLV92_10674 [Kineococcus xinjiangensis]
MRRFAEAVHVRTGVVGGTAPAPAQFLWRGRFYVVHDVLACWRERSAWWEASVAAVHGADLPTGDPVEDTLAEVEREVWRVEASAGRSSSAGVYDLCRPAAPGTAATPAPLDDGAWRLLRVSD